MSKALSAFTPIPHQSNIWSSQKGSLRCTALKLSDGSLCLYSPVLGISDEAYDCLAALGKVSFLLAPNHYHNKGLAEYTKAFPDATLICSEHARPRLKKQTRMAFELLSALVSLLPDGCNMTEPEGLKTGEVWLTLETSNNHIWVVCDAFTGSKTKLGGISKKVELLGTFPTYGINDHQTYKR